MEDTRGPEGPIEQLVEEVAGLLVANVFIPECFMPGDQFFHEAIVDSSVE